MPEEPPTPAGFANQVATLRAGRAIPHAWDQSRQALDRWPSHRRLLIVDEPTHESVRRILDVPEGGWP
jgi:hypothetical protein